ncbi:MAG: DUF6498-containing protein [Anaerolineaceae bacterium]|nr:DUF6498-containing protein [Anaerolineaceae bacterium]
MSKKLDQNKYQELKDRIRLKPDDVDSNLALGNLLADAGEKQKAQFFFQRVLELQPENIEAQVNLDRIREPSNTKIITSNLDASFWIDQEIPLWLQLIISLIAFIFIFLIAEIQKWTAADMVWSLWITSLTIGYCYLIAGITSNAIRSGLNTEEGVLSKLIGDSLSSGVKFGFILIGALFQFLFFTVHFGLFHFVHSIFLNEFFPLMDRSFEDFSDFWFFIRTSLLAYWPVFIFTLAASLRKLQKVIQQSDANFAKTPYLNVVKIHLSIFLFAFLSSTNIPEWVLPFLFIVYFFPFSASLEYLKEMTKKPDLPN